MGNEAVYLVINSMRESDHLKLTLREFLCNFNDITASHVTRTSLNILLSEDFKALQYVEFRGNILNKKFKLSYIEQFKLANRRLSLF